MRILSKQKNRLLQFLNFTTSAVDRPPLHIPKNRELVKSSGGEQQLLLQHYSPNDDSWSWSLVSSSDKWSSATEKFFSLPSLPFAEKYLAFAPSCNGLLHFYNASGLQGGVWNPARKEFKCVYPSRVERPYQTSSSAGEVSFMGFDSNAQDYKLLKLVENFIPEDTVEPDGQGEYFAQIEVYSFKTESWKELFTEYTATQYDRPGLCRPYVYVNGRIYCNSGDHIKSFDFTEERFSRVYWPPVGKGWKQVYDFNLVEIDGQLGCIVWPLVGTRKTFDLWVMEGDGTWIKAVSIRVRGNRRLLFFWGNGDQLMFLHEGDGELQVYDCSTNQLTELGITIDLGKDTRFFPYVEQTTVPLAQQLSTDYTFTREHILKY